MTGFRLPFLPLLVLSVAGATGCPADDDGTPGDEAGDVMTTTDTDTDPGDDAPATDDGATDDGATGGDSNLCDPNDMHGTICECEAGAQEVCEEGGVRFCFWRDFDVSADQLWGPCGDCVPGDTAACDADGVAGIQYCNATDTVSVLPETGPTFGDCVAETDLVCELGTSEACPDNAERDRYCRLDDAGVPQWDESSCV